MDYLEVINHPIDINLGIPFVVSIDVFPEVIVPCFALTFVIKGHGLFFTDQGESGDLPYKITKHFNYNSELYIQRFNVTLNITGSLTHFPVRTVMHVFSENSSSPVNCIINIYGAII